MLHFQAEKQAQLTATNTSITSNNNNNVHNSGTAVTSNNLSEPSAQSLLASPSSKTKLSTTNTMTENIVTGSNSSMSNQTTSPNVGASKYQQQTTTNTTNLIPGYPFGYNEMMSK